MSIVAALLWCVSEMTFQTELARHPGNDAHQMVLTPITKWNVTFYREMWLESAFVQLSFRVVWERANMNYGVEPSFWMKERKKEKGNVFVEREVFLLRQSGALFRRSHTRKSPEWESPSPPPPQLSPLKKTFLESLHGRPKLSHRSKFLYQYCKVLYIYPHSGNDSFGVFYWLQASKLR